jgi:hypothetical protein
MDEGTRRVELADEPQGTRRVPLGAELDAEGTRRVPADLTAAAADAPVGLIPLAWQPPGAMLLNKYKVVETRQLHETQRPGLYLCEAPQGLFMVKVHAAELQPDAQLWARLLTLRHPNLMQLIEATEAGGFYYEVQEYYKGGSLASHVPASAEGLNRRADWLKEHFLPRVVAGLLFLHRHGVIHRDIKPANIFLREGVDGEIVLGDYDISTTVDPGETSRRSTRFMATHVYAAPELFPQIGSDGKVRTRVSLKSDYWSLGITCIELLVGTTTAHQEGAGGLQQFFMTGRSVAVPQGLPEDVTLLLRGLLIRDDQLRWGDDEVARWLAGQTTDKDRAAIDAEGAAVAGATALRPYKLGNYTASNVRQLAEAIFKEPELAVDDLLEGDLLINWVGQLDTNIARQLRRDRERYRRSPEHALQSALLHLDPTLPFDFGQGRQARTPEEWAALAEQQLGFGPRQYMVLGAREALESLALWLELRQPAEKGLAESVRQLSAYENAHHRIEGVLWLLEPGKPFSWGSHFSANTPAEVVRIAYGSIPEWQQGEPLAYTALRSEVESGRLAVWLTARGLPELARELTQHVRMSDGYKVLQLEKALRMLDPALAPVQVKLDASQLKRRLGVLYGGERVYEVPWLTEGPGVPYAVIERSSHNAPRVDPPLLSAREGTLYVTLDARDGLQPVGRYEAMLQFTSGTATVNPATLEADYRVQFPNTQLLRRIGVGAFAGMAILLTLRLLLVLLLGPVPLTLSQIDLPYIWEDALSVNLDTLPFVACLVLILLTFYGSYRLLLHVLSHGEV